MKETAMAAMSADLSVDARRSGLEQGMARTPSHERTRHRIGRRLARAAVGA
jgi:hypothetical protein